ncbi:class I SAM-dependent methyltransferase [Oscillochloris sp. ZM17-4]|uniref:class I SAM-dependent DNA methyltransferase n=1 Tax=Oscillochloris sp. ZM17-4 TaxID=2866714 RepID=UPI001C73916F|nr:class I SAM-dependent methyltransferase [Oscillochloris sp. ZM17-4]MBX0329284.1 class I SAM-dependent methyltransferase [Oscillochloris sp. ZM17-4]
MIYDRYAALYDSSGQVRFALLVAVYLRELLARHPAPGNRVLDLACGTGTLAMGLADEGWHVTGLDAAPAMIAQAEAKSVGATFPGSARFVCGDMRDAARALPPAAFDLVTCTYDSLNYMLSESDLLACFQSAADALSPGGLFIGDMNTQHFLEFEWGTCAVRELEGFVQIEQSHFDPQLATSTMVLTGFVGDDDEGYERFDEVHVERAYPMEFVDVLMARVGLTVEAHYDSFTLSPPGPYTQRIFWVARKRGAAAADAAPSENGARAAAPLRDSTTTL